MNRLKQNRRKTLTEKRLRKGFSQEEAARFIGINRPSYTKIELGLIDPPTSLALKIASLLDSTVEELFGCASNSVIDTKQKSKGAQIKCIHNCV